MTCHAKVTCQGLGKSLLQQRAEKAEELAKARLEEVSKEKARADEETKIATAINAFLQELLEQADIGRQSLLGGAAMERNPNVTAKELLDRAARGIESRFADQPRTEAAIRLTIGDAYIALGRYEKAQLHLERSVQLRIAKLGPDSSFGKQPTSSPPTMYPRPAALI